MVLLEAKCESLRKCCRCGEQATSELFYAKDLATHEGASSPTPLSLLDMDMSFQTLPAKVVTALVPIPEEVQLPSPLASEGAPLPVPPPQATTPGRLVSGQHCWTACKAEHSKGPGASG